MRRMLLAVETARRKDAHARSVRMAEATSARILACAGSGANQSRSFFKQSDTELSLIGPGLCSIT